MSVPSIVESGSLHLFVDGSVNPQSKVGYGACLLINSEEQYRESVQYPVETKRFEHTSSTRLELQALLWSLSFVEKENKEIVIYTDCQNIIELPGRRLRLEQKKFGGKNGGVLLNKDLYRSFYEKMDAIHFKLTKVDGHKKKEGKSREDLWFTLVDKASRMAMRKDRHNSLGKAEE